jgi:hypothetical protein
MILASTQTNSGAKTFLDTTLLLRNVPQTLLMVLLLILIQLIEYIHYQMLLEL